MKNRWRQIAVAALALLGCWAAVPTAQAQRVGVSIGIGIPGPVYRPWGYYPRNYYYYRPYPVYVAPAPVYVTPPPVVVQSAPTVVTEPVPVMRPWNPAPTTVVATPSPTPNNQRETTITQWLQQLTSQDDQVRLTAVEQLGKMLADRAVDSLTAVLAGDRSAPVREAAARSLGLIGAPRALPALIRAAQADSDRDVRRSAQFTVEIIHSRLKQQ